MVRICKEPHLVVLWRWILSYISNRVWCRFGCPMAAILGLQQRLFSKFRITTNGTCISCGNCSTYCEMGIDVRSYAQKAKTSCLLFLRCCGICAAVCPRGVLKLENDTPAGRINSNEILLEMTSI
jgi:Fe-S-cluster-containing hydrogenase component 2